MRALLSFAFVLLAEVQGQRLKAPIRLVRREVYGNGTLSYTNSSTPTITSILTTSSTPAILPPNSTITEPPAETCVGSVTYFGSIPPTVYETVTEGFDVTVTASNVSITETPTLVTPLPPCQATVMPLVGSVQSLESIADSTETSSSDWPSTTATDTSGKPLPNPHATSQLATESEGAPAQTSGEVEATPAPQQPPPEFSATVVASIIFSSVPYTSTVIVTKKTPVPVVVPPTTPPPSYQPPPPTPTPNPPPNQNNGATSPPPVGGGDSNASNDRAPAPANTGAALITKSATTTGLGNIIASIINSPYNPPAPASSPSPRTTVIDNIPITIFPSSVAIGSQVLPIPPASSQTAVFVNGETFTVRQSEIIAAATTLAIVPDVTTPPRTITAAPGAVVTIGGTTAIVAGTTYRIGAGATPTTVVLSGQTISFGPAGVGFATTTIAATAGAITDAPMVVETAGGLVLSIDGSEVVIDGTTFRIGTGAPTLTTVVDGKTLSIGPGGVGFKTTTVKPTTATAETGNRSTGGGASATAGVGLQNAGVGIKIPIAEMLGWLLVTCVAGRLLS